MQVCRDCGNENQASARFCNWCGAALASISPTGLLAARAPLHSGRYLIVERVGQGGMGAVYKALDTAQRPGEQGSGYVAIKEMSQSGLTGADLQEAIASFASEARMLAHLHHKSLPRIYHQFEEKGRRYLVMEFIEGETVEHYNEGFLQRGKQMPVEKVLDIAIQLCEVLEYLHAQSQPIIFRDLKPANVMLSPQGRVYLIDFGIARLFKPQQTRDTVIMGSPGYASPEQYKGQTSPRSDLYSLGAMLHQLLSGQDPSQNPLHLRPFGHRLPELEQLVMSTVEIDEMARPASAYQVRQALLKIARELHLHKGTVSVAPDHSGTAAPTQSLLHMCVIVSAARKDQLLWRILHKQLKLQCQSLSTIQIEPVDLSGQQQLPTLLAQFTQADLVLCLLSEDFLRTSLCTLLARQAITQESITGTPVLAALLRPCIWQETELADITLLSPDVIMHASVYAQQLRIIDLVKRMHTILARMLLTGKQTGAMNLSQWLLWQLYGSGEANCPFFVSGQYTVINVRPAGRGGVLFYVFDHRNGYVVSEQVIISPTSASVEELLRILEPGTQDPEDVQGLALRERPANLELNA